MKTRHRIMLLLLGVLVVAIVVALALAGRDSERPAPDGVPLGSAAAAEPLSAPSLAAEPMSV